MRRLDVSKGRKLTGALYVYIVCGENQSTQKNEKAWKVVAKVESL